MREESKLVKKRLKAIDEVVPPTTKTELQSLLVEEQLEYQLKYKSKINFIRRFISNLSKKVLPFSPLLKLKNDQELKWCDVQQKAFKEIKEYMKCPPVLVPPQQGKPFKLYVSAMTKQLDRP